LLTKEVSRGFLRLDFFCKPAKEAKEAGWRGGWFRFLGSPSGLLRRVFAEYFGYSDVLFYKVCRG
jgi:hypothetical protein